MPAATPAVPAPVTSLSVAETKPPVVASKPPAPAPEAIAGDDSGSIEVRANDTCWVDGWRDGRHFHAAMLHSGGVLHFAPGAHLRLRFGNAGAVAVSVGGQSLGELGPLGQPRSIECDGNACQLTARAAPPQ
jgi:hypothetical protein